MVDDIRNTLNYNYKITAQKFRDTSINAERFGNPQPLYDSPERCLKTLEDLVSIIKELKKDRKYGLVDSYSENGAIVKIESKSVNLLREIQSGLQIIELSPEFIKKARDIFDIYDEVMSGNSS